MSLQDDSSSSVPPSVEDRVETRTWTEISSFAQEISRPVMLPEHHHDEHQLMWVTSGSALVTTQLGAWLVAPGSGLWMPAGVVHTMSMSPPGSFRTLYLVPTLTPPGPRWECAHSLTVGPTLGAIIHRLDGTALDDERRARSAAVLVDLLDESSLGESTLPVPDDSRAAIVARSILGNPADARDLHEWADEIGVSTRTHARAFREETSLTSAPGVRVLASARRSATCRTVRASTRPRARSATPRPRPSSSRSGYLWARAPAPMHGVIARAGRRDTAGTRSRTSRVRRPRILVASRVTPPHGRLDSTRFGAVAQLVRAGDS